MDDPLMLTAATTLVAWATTNLAEGARSTVTDLTEFLRRRFRGEAAVQELVEVGRHPPAPDTARRLATLLEQEAERDPAFDAEFRARYAQVRAVVANHAGNVTNTVSGDVAGPVVQARDVHGGISFGGWQPR
ncbi:hypothetical protein M8I35_03515 [Micromonospora sp. MSM11]|nr:hypothetical protein [Micromonospora sp. MSM11]MCL7456250.1 hypothetical protein [Micromonospora sp. MSM11]